MTRVAILKATVTHTATSPEITDELETVELDEAYDGSVADPNNDTEHAEITAKVNIETIVQIPNTVVLFVYCSTT